MPSPWTLLTPTGINVQGSYGASISIRFDVLKRDFGGGYKQTALLGPTAGLIVLRLKYDFLTDSTVLTVADPENSNAVTEWSRYFWKFYIRRQQDQAAFYATFTDPATGAAESSKQFLFTEPELTYEEVEFKLYNSAMTLEQFIPLA